MSNLAFQLLAAVNYIDALGGVSQSWRQALAAHEAAKPASILTQDEIDGLYAMHGGDGGPTAICEQFAPALIRAVMAAESDDLEIHSSDANLIGKHTALWVNYMALKDELEKLREQLAAHEAAKPEYWEYRPLISHGVWERVTPRILGQTVEELVSELLAYRYKGKQCYEVRALYAAPVAVASPWHPIETAPKDKLVLLFGAKRSEMVVGMFHTRDGWVIDTPAEWASMYTPSHWMPLPQAPKEQA